MAAVELHVDAQSGIATITLNRPDVLNAIDVDLAWALHHAVMPLERRDDIRCIVLCGAGKAFCAGGNVAEFNVRAADCPALIEELLDALNPVVELFSRYSAPIMASVHGVVAGAGLSLVSGCDLAIAADNTRFLMAYDKVAAAPDCGGTWYLPQRLGYARATELMLLGDAWSAEEARAAGLVNRVVPARQLESEAAALAARLAAGPTRAFGQWKHLARAAFGNKLPAHLEDERNAFKCATRTQDFREGVMAFLERRQAHFTNK